MDDTPYSRSAAVKAAALECGFTLAGISRPKISPYGDVFAHWLTAGKQGEMAYLARNPEERGNPGAKFPWAKSILSVALAYYQPASGANGGEKKDAVRIARYAWGRDYHKVMEAKLKRLEKKMRAQFDAPGAKPMQIRAYVDTGPLMEREIAANAGLGWIGKHTLLIHPRHGSWFLLGELVLSMELEPDSPVGNHCGTCTRCIQACPTQAIEPYSVDARKCISYLTIEHRAAIAPEFHSPMKDAGFLVGCDICQEVCPFNRAPLVTTEPDFAPRSPAPAASLQDVLAWQEQEWDILTRGRATRRVKFGMWKRNAEILAAGSEKELPK
jgi:epoxyqueuosine reductase